MPGRTGHTGEVVLRLSRDQILRFRAGACHLDIKLPAGSYAAGAWGGLQDSAPRSGVLALHARVDQTTPDAWEDPSVAQIWFRSGTDFIVPRADVGIFTLGSLPRDVEEARRLHALADEIHRVTDGRVLKVREVIELLDSNALHPRFAAPTGRVQIRWDASSIWLIPVESPDLDPERARLELARRFLHWSGPTTVDKLTRFAGLRPADAATTWSALEGELLAVEVAGERRFVLGSDEDALRANAPIGGVRLLPWDDPYTKLDRDLLVPDATQRRLVLPGTGESRGWIPGAVLVDGEIVGAWQRQRRKVAIHPFRRLPAAVRQAIETEALSFPIAGADEPAVRWEETPS
jgi:hypothetical protein